MKFDKLRNSSPNSGFDISSGKFICPVDGVYYFQIWFISKSGGHQAPGIYVDGSAHCHAFAQEPLRSHTCAIIVKLTKGQSVYVSNNIGSKAIREDPYSGFLGYLISQ